jgi:hypothetical protein
MKEMNRFYYTDYESGTNDNDDYINDDEDYNYDDMEPENSLDYFVDKSKATHQPNSASLSFFKMNSKDPLTIYYCIFNIKFLFLLAIYFL